MSTPDYFTPDEDWKAFASKIGYPCPTNPPPPTADPIVPFGIDIHQAREGQAAKDAKWAAAHPLASVGYEARLIPFKVSDGTEISVRISYPSSERLAGKNDISTLPVLFVMHGGGCMQGSHLSEEAWLVWSLYEHFDLLVVSVEYRLAPEHQSPIWIEDSWDVLQDLISPASLHFSNLAVQFDPRKTVLAGSSSGANIGAVLAQMCRDEKIPIAGVVLNVPVLCDYRQLPAKYANGDQQSSYKQCVANYSSGAMAWVWNTIHPDLSTGADPKVSPLLGDCADLPPHAIFVAGQDALRDEGIAYATRLKENGVKVELEIYPGVPHNFAHYPNLKATVRFQDNLRAALGRLLEVAPKDTK